MQNTLRKVGELWRSVQGHRIWTSIWMCADEKPRKILELLDVTIDHFSSFSPPPHLQTNFLLRSRNSRAINITSFWPEKERAQTKMKAALKTRETTIYGWTESGLRCSEGRRRAKTRREYAPLWWWWICKDPHFSLLVCLLLFAVLFSGLINWLINNKTSSHAFHLPAAAHMETLFVARTSLPLSIGSTNTHIVSGLSKKKEGY